MDFKKIYKRGLGFLFLLLIFIIGVLFIPNLNKKQVFDGNSIFTSGPDDAYEENDFDGQAYDLTSFSAKWLTEVYGPGFQWDEDWYLVYLDPGEERIHVELNFWHMEGDINLEVYYYDGGSFTYLAGSYDTSDKEIIDSYAPWSGFYYIRVYGPNAGNEYDMFWEDLPPSTTADDFYEFNDEPHMLHKDHPSNLMEYEQTWLSDLHGMAVQGNNDWYIIDVTPGFEHLIIELKFNHSLGNIGLDIYDEWGYWITGNNSDTDNENIDFWLPHRGMYGIIVYGNNWGNEYDMWWDDLKTDLRSDDNYELNNDPSSAYDISFAQNKSLWEMNGLALQFDEDWYEIYVDGSNLELIVWLPYDSAEGLMGFEVYDEDLNKITGNFTLTDNDYIVHDVSNGTHYIRVFGDNSGNVYNLWWATQESEEIGMIPGYDLLILIASIIGISTVGIKIKRSKLKHK